MENVTFIDVETLAGIETHAIVDLGNNEFISMPKSMYDAQQEAIANYVPPTGPRAEETPVVEETAPEEEAPPVEEETT